MHEQLMIALEWGLSNKVGIAIGALVTFLYLFTVLRSRSLISEARGKLTSTQDALAAQRKVSSDRLDQLTDMRVAKNEALGREADALVAATKLRERVEVMRKGWVHCARNERFFQVVADDRLRDLNRLKDAVRKLKDTEDRNIRSAAKQFKQLDSYYCDVLANVHKDYKALEDEVASLKERASERTEQLKALKASAAEKEAAMAKDLALAKSSPKITGFVGPVYYVDGIGKVSNGTTPIGKVSQFVEQDVEIDGKKTKILTLSVQ